MLSQFGQSTIWAILIGGVLAVLAFLPVVAVRYRKAGRLRFIDLVMLLLCAVYAMSLWTYTLIPLPETVDYVCAKSNFHPLAFISDIRKHWSNNGSFISALRHNWPFMQTVFNVVFFFPLGALLRLVARRGVVVATALGLIISLLIETTQYTGDWWLYPCAYRSFDVDDLLTNTLGAMLGSLIVWPIARLLKSHPERQVTVVTAGRRVLGVIADLFLIGFIGFSVAMTSRIFQIYLLGIPTTDIDPTVEWIMSNIPILLLEASCVLIAGRTCGEAIVDLRPIETRRSIGKRLIKLGTGIGGYLVLGYAQYAFPTGPLSSVISPSLTLFCLVSLIMLFTTKDHRGLSGVASRLPMGINPPKAATPGE